MLGQRTYACSTSQDNARGTSLVVQWVRLPAPNAGSLCSIPGQGTRFHMPQLSVTMLQLLHNQITKQNILKKDSANFIFQNDFTKCALPSTRYIEAWDGVGGGRKVQEGGDICMAGSC